MVSSLLSLAVVSMAGLAQARSELFQRRVNDECCPCPVSGSPGPQQPVTVTVTQGPAPTAPDTVTVYVTQGQPGPSEAAKETVTVNHTVTAPGTTITAPGTTVTAPGTTVYVGGNVPAGSAPSQQQTNLPSPEHGNPSANENKVQNPSVVTHTVFLPNQSAQMPATSRASVITITTTLPQDNTQPQATGSRPSPNNSNGSGPGNSQTPNGQAPNNQPEKIQTPNKEAYVDQAHNNQAPNNQAPNNQAPSIQTVTVSQSPNPKVQTVTVTQGTANTQPVGSASVVTVTAAPSSQPVPPYIQYPEFYQTVTQTVHNGDTTNIEINITNIINGDTFCFVQGTNNPCGHNVVINNPGSPQATAAPNSPQGAAAAGAPSSMITTTSCPTPQNSTSIATVYNTVTATISQGRGANDTAGFWAARPTGAARLPRNPVRRMW
ncbi:unnamed protein product [Clonostachys rosea]|uniref:Uncharacterized protein n=1 Tax=Bionectria ochroleuca TaxID=29856 RepID=A0ABY6V3B0_BIOOC|nr:unnamed protein product [Clonostachys rosea]